MTPHIYHTFVMGKGIFSIFCHCNNACCNHRSQPFLDVPVILHRDTNKRPSRQPYQNALCMFDFMFKTMFSSSFMSKQFFFLTYVSPTWRILCADITEKIVISNLIFYKFFETYGFSVN